MGEKLYHDPSSVAEIVLYCEIEIYIVSHMMSTKLADSADKSAPGGSQTLLRGLDVLDVIAKGPVDVARLAAALGLSKSTAYRLASTLVERRFLVFTPREGYSLGPKLMQLGYAARNQTALVRVAEPHLMQLSSVTEDTVHLAMLDQRKVLYLNIIPGQRRIVISSRIGERQPLTSTGLGKALILNRSEKEWEQFYIEEGSKHRSQQSFAAWLKRMKDYRRQGITLDLEENEANIRCVAAPVLNEGGDIIAAISVTGHAQNMTDDRMRSLSEDVLHTAQAISADLGYSGG